MGAKPRLWLVSCNPKIMVGDFPLFLRANFWGPPSGHIGKSHRTSDLTGRALGGVHGFPGVFDDHEIWVCLDGQVAVFVQSLLLFFWVTCLEKNTNKQQLAIQVSFLGLPKWPWVTFLIWDISFVLLVSPMYWLSFLAGFPSGFPYLTRPKPRA